jgi:hypothetical protein
VTRYSGLRRPPVSGFSGGRFSSRGLSSVGRALSLHGRCQGFDSPRLHFRRPLRPADTRAEGFFVYGVGAGSKTRSRPVLQSTDHRRLSRPEDPAPLARIANARRSRGCREPVHRGAHCHHRARRRRLYRAARRVSRAAQTTQRTAGTMTTPSPRASAPQGRSRPWTAVPTQTQRSVSRGSASTSATPMRPGWPAPRASGGRGRGRRRPAQRPQPPQLGGDAQSAGPHPGNPARPTDTQAPGIDAHQWTRRPGESHGTPRAGADAPAYLISER